MKKIKTFLFAGLLMIGTGLTSSCTDYQDEVDALDDRVTALENLVSHLDSLANQTNNQLKALQELANAIDSCDFITGVDTLYNPDKTIKGYVLHFHNSDDIVINNGVDGEVPNITIKKGTDGKWYWYIDGEVITDKNGNPIVANGKDAVQPELRINDDGYWEYYISVDENGNPIWVTTTTKATGKDGEDGVFNGVITEIVYHTGDKDGGYITITTKDGQTLKIPVISKEK